MPILTIEQKLAEKIQDDINKGIHDSSESNLLSSSRKILPDGTYATESALISETQMIDNLESEKVSEKPLLRCILWLFFNSIFSNINTALILDGDYYLGSVLSSTLVKLIMRYSEISKNTSKLNFMCAEGMLIMTGIIRVGQSKYVKMHIDEDSIDRILICLRSLIEYQNNPSIKDIFLKDTKNAFINMLSIEENKEKTSNSLKKKDILQPDDAIIPSLLASKSNIEEMDLVRIY